MTMSFNSFLLLPIRAIMIIIKIKNFNNYDVKVYEKRFAINEKSFGGN
jgi:hypothetical protein